MSIEEYNKKRERLRLQYEAKLVELDKRFKKIQFDQSIDPTITKCCTKCGKDQLLKYFHKTYSSRHKHGVKNICKICVSISRLEKLKRPII